MPVGHIWKFDLKEHKTRNFGGKFNFSKFRMEPVMLNFLATTEKIRKKDQNIRFTIAGKYLKKQREIAIRNFQIQKQNASRAVLS